MLDRLEAAIIGTPGYTELRWLWCKYQFSA